MSTHAITVVHNEEKDLLGMYIHFDGYPTRHGEDLKKFLLQAKFQDAADLATQLEKKFNDQYYNCETYIGSDHGQRWTYDVYVLDNGAIKLEVTERFNNNIAFDGDQADFDPESI